MPVKYHDVEQGSQAWFDCRLGLVTASEAQLIITESTLKAANNEKIRAHIYELAAQRITKFIEPRFESDDMLRGKIDEEEARALYSERYAPVTQVGFLTNDKWGFTLGYSPDGLVNDDGAIEAKSRRQKFQVQTLIENLLNDTIPGEYVMQHQTGLLVSERQWIDFISFSKKLPMAVIRVYPDDKIQAAIIEAAQITEAKIKKIVAQYEENFA